MDIVNDIMTFGMNNYMREECCYVYYARMIYL